MRNLALAVVTGVLISGVSPQASALTMNEMLESTKDEPMMRTGYFLGAIDMIYNEVRNGTVDFSECTLARFRDGQLLKLINDRLSDPKDGATWGSMPAALVIRTAAWTLCDPPNQKSPPNPSK